jgi:hypothetical protein
MAKIAIDIDSTLYDFETPAREGFLKLAQERNDKEYFKGAYDAWMEWRSPADSMGVDVWLEVIKLCHDAEVIQQQVPFTGAVETCQALINEGHTLMYISNRLTESTEATIDWLNEWGFLPTGEEEIVCMMNDKKRYLVDCQYLIDDRPKTLVEFVYDWDWNGPLHKNLHSERRKAFGLKYPYNQALTDIPNVYLAPTWAGIGFYLVGKGVLSEPAVTPTLKV